MQSKPPIVDLSECMYPTLAQKAYDMGLIAGVDTSDGRKLLPKREANREEVWLLLLRMMEMMNVMVNHDIPAIIRQAKPSIVRIWNSAKATVGSGAFIGPRLILTNAHVISQTDTVQVDTFDREKVTGKVLRSDPMIDLALVELQTEKSYPPLPIEENIIQGEANLVLGNPLGEWFSASLGIVTRFGGDYLQTDALINPGNSGGAVINLKCGLIGVPTFKIVFQATDNHNYSVMAHRIRKFINQG